MDEARYAQVLRFPNRQELKRRFPPLVVGLLVLGFSIGFEVRAELDAGGSRPWVQLTRGQAESLGIETGRTVWLRAAAGASTLAAPLAEPIALATALAG